MTLYKNPSKTDKRSSSCVITKKSGVEKSRIRKGRYIIKKNCKNVNKSVKNTKKIIVSGSKRFILLKRASSVQKTSCGPKVGESKKKAKKDLIQIAREKVNVDLKKKLRKAKDLIVFANRLRKGQFGSNGGAKGKIGHNPRIVTRIDRRSRKPIMIGFEKRRVTYFETNNKIVKEEPAGETCASKQDAKEEKGLGRFFQPWDNCSSSDSKKSSCSPPTPKLGKARSYDLRATAFQKLDPFAPKKFSKFSIDYNNRKTKKQETVSEKLFTVKNANRKKRKTAKFVSFGLTDQIFKCKEKKAEPTAPDQNGGSSSVGCKDNTKRERKATFGNLDLVLEN